MSRRDFLVEIGTEELPPLALKTLADAFAAGVAQGLDAAQLKHGQVRRFATPRRLAVFVKGLAEQQPEQQIKRRGPPVSAAFDAQGRPTRAALAFAQSCGVPIEFLQRVSEAKGEFLFYSGRKPGVLARDLLTGIVQTVLDALPIPKRMRWGGGDVEFVRPVHWVLMLFGSDVLPARILGVESGGVSYGHRFHAPKALRISSPGSYVNALRGRGYVLADFDERREAIRGGVAETARLLNGEAVVTEELLDEVTALVEWPVPMAGHFDARFLDLPREVLIATLQDHQRYFPVQENVQEGGSANAARCLLPHFIAVANLESRDPEQVRMGNERVVRPRLSDAAFFYETDRKQTLGSRGAELARVTFQTKLGSLADKVHRVRELAREIATQLQGNVELAVRAAELSKCDLLTLMVGEFPELQGTMGRYYALHDGEPEEVAQAIAEHYLPRFAGDDLPATVGGMAVAIADKLDTIAGIFAIDQKPSGTRDPFGLRRAALGLLRIIIEKNLSIDLTAAIRAALERVRRDIDRIRRESTAGGGHGTLSTPEGAAKDSVGDDIYDYIMERLRTYYLEHAGKDGATITVTTEMFDAVLAMKPVLPLDCDARIRALEQFLKLKDAASLTQANKRIANILKQAGAQLPEGAPDRAALQHDAERQLFGELERLEREVTPQFSARNYRDGLLKLAGLRAPVDAFFNEVMVMDPDLAVRANRLKLLSGLRGLFLKVADLSRLPG